MQNEQWTMKNESKSPKKKALLISRLLPTCRSLGFIVRHFLFKSGAGFTLIETVVALALIVSGVVGAFSLALTGVTDASVSKNKLIAVNLAQEGIELVRKIRDDNELAGNANWVAYLFPGALCSYSWKIDLFTTTGPLVSSDGSPLNYAPAMGLYSYSSVGASPSLFTRQIQVERPGGAGCMQGKRAEFPDSVQMRVRSIVTWNERSLLKTVSLEEAFYDW